MQSVLPRSLLVNLGIYESKGPKLQKRILCREFIAVPQDFEDSHGLCMSQASPFLPAETEPVEWMDRYR